MRQTSYCTRTEIAQGEGEEGLVGDQQTEASVDIRWHVPANRSCQRDGVVCEVCEGRTQAETVAQGTGPTSRTRVENGADP